MSLKLFCTIFSTLQKKKKYGVNIITHTYYFAVWYMISTSFFIYYTWYPHLFYLRYTTHKCHWTTIELIPPNIFQKKKKKSVSKISQFIHTNHLLQLHCCLNLNSTNWPSKLHYHYRHPKIFTHQPHHTTWSTYQNQINEDSKSCTIALPTTLLLSTMAIWWTSHPYQHTKIPIMNPL